MHKLSFVALSLLLAFTSCKKEDEELNCSVEYDVLMPTPLLEIADAYAEYTDNGQTYTEPMRNGQFKKTFSYSWKDGGVKEHHLNFTSIKIYLRPKVSESQFKEGAQLLKDDKAYITAILHYSYHLDKENAWSGSSTSNTSSGNVGGTFHWSTTIQDYKYTIVEQISYFNSQNTDPYADFSFDHKGLSIGYTGHFNSGQPETKSNTNIVEVVEM